MESLKNDAAETKVVGRRPGVGSQARRELQQPVLRGVRAPEEEELFAIHDTIKLLNDDDALKLFKAILPNPSLVQARSSTALLADELRR